MSSGTPRLGLGLMSHLQHCTRNQIWLSRDVDYPAVTDPLHSRELRSFIVLDGSGETEARAHLGPLQIKR